MSAPTPVPNNPEPDSANLPEGAKEVTRTMPQDRPPPDMSGSASYTPAPGPDTVSSRPSMTRGSLDVPGYEVGDRIGIGGMGVVYAARQIELDREVAIKFLRFDLQASDEALKRFETEARVTARMPHPCIPPVYAFGRLRDGRPFLVMKRIYGCTLHDLLKEQANAGDLSRLLQIFEQVCQAVGFAHDHRVIHRDLKPRNIMVGKFGEVQVMDWGIAKQLPPADSELAIEAGMTIAGRPMGTVDYMPPEQAKGEWEQVDTRADVFALGAILCTILTGEPPYSWGTSSHHVGKASDANLALAVERLRACDRDPGLVAIAVACLARNPADRPPTGAAVAQLVEEFRKHVADRLRIVEVEKAVADEAARIELARIKAGAEAEIAAIKSRAKEARRRRWRLVRIGAAAVLTLGLLAAGGLVWWQNGKIGRAVASAEAGEKAYEEGNRRGAIDEFKLARTRYENLVNDSSMWNRSQHRLALARVNLWLGKLHVEERDAAAATFLTAAEDLLESLRASVDRPEYSLVLAEVYHNRGIHYGNTGDLKKAEENYTKGLSQRLSAPKVLQQDPEFRRNLARSYGYLGDAQIELGNLTGAEQSYTSAYKLREELANEQPESLDAQCLHARDFQNFGKLYARGGQVGEAIKEHGKRLDYYAQHLAPFSPLLPGEYKTERAGTYCDIAELELDRPEPAADTPKLLDKAKAEYDLLRDGADEMKCSPDIQAGLARVYVCQARLYHRQGNAVEQVREAAERAVKLLTQLDDDGKAQPSDYYNLAVAYALGKTSDSGENRVLALDRLKKAIRKNYSDRPRLERDRCLKDVFGEDRFNDIVKGLPWPVKKAP